MSSTGGGADGRLLLLRYAAADRGAVLMRAATLVSVIGGYPLIFQATLTLTLALTLAVTLSPNPNPNPNLNPNPNPIPPKPNPTR